MTGDIDLQRGKLEESLKALAQWKEHPLTNLILEDSRDQQERCITLILDIPVTNIETFLAREQALGHLRGLRRPMSLVQDRQDEIAQELKELD